MHAVFVRVPTRHEDLIMIERSHRVLITCNAETRCCQRSSSSDVRRTDLRILESWAGYILQEL